MPQRRLSLVKLGILLLTFLTADIPTKFAYNPEGLWGFKTDPSRLRRRVIRVDNGVDLPPYSLYTAVQWDDTSRAGAEFSEAEDVLSDSSYQSHAVVVGELVPAADVTRHSLGERNKKEHDGSLSLRACIKWLELDKPDFPCVVVRLISSEMNIFHVLTQKSPSDGICCIRVTTHHDTRAYIAVYDEWAGDGHVAAKSSRINAVKDNLDRFCNEYRKKCQAIAQSRQSAKLNMSASQVQPRAGSSNAAGQVAIGTTGESDISHGSALDACLTRIFAKDTEYVDTDAREFLKLQEIKVCGYKSEQTTIS